MMSIIIRKYNILFSWKEGVDTLGEQTDSAAFSSIVEMRLQKL